MSQDSCMVVMVPGEWHMNVLNPTIQVPKAVIFPSSILLWLSGQVLTPQTKDAQVCALKHRWNGGLRDWVHPHHVFKEIPSKLLGFESWVYKCPQLVSALVLPLNTLSSATKKISFWGTKDLTRAQENAVLYWFCQISKKSTEKHPWVRGALV